jgi:HK97 family phage portal protein
MANFLTSIASRVAGVFSRPPLPPRYMDGWQANVPGLDDTHHRGSAAGFASLNRGISIIVGNLVSTPLLVKSGTKEVPDSPVAKCLQNTRASHFEAAYYDQIQTGNGWFRIVKTNGVATRLEHIQAHRMSAQITVDGQVEYLLDAQPINYSEFVHLMCRNAYSAYVGESIVEHHSTSIAMVLATSSIYRQLQSNGSFADIYLQTDKDLNKEQTTRLRELYASQTSNKHSSGGTVILTNGLSPMAVKKLPSALESDIVKSLDWTVAESARMTGVPLSFLAVKDAVAYNSAIEAGREFLRNTLRPIMRKIESELAAKLGATVYFDLGELVLGFGQERADVLSKLTYSGLMSINEARETLGYGSIKDGDTTGMPSNQLPLANWLDNGLQSQPTAPTPAANLAMFRARKGI